MKWAGQKRNLQRQTDDEDWMIGRERLVCRFHLSFEKEKEGVFTGFPSFTLRKIKIKKRECEKKCECF